MFLSQPKQALISKLAGGEKFFLCAKWARKPFKKCSGRFVPFGP